MERCSYDHATAGTLRARGGAKKEKRHGTGYDGDVASNSFRHPTGVRCGVFHSDAGRAQEGHASVEKALSSINRLSLQL